MLHILNQRATDVKFMNHEDRTVSQAAVNFLKANTVNFKPANPHERGLLRAVEKSVATQ